MVGWFLRMTCYSLRELSTSQLKMSQEKWLVGKMGRATVVWSPFDHSLLFVQYEPLDVHLTNILGPIIHNLPWQLQSRLPFPDQSPFWKLVDLT